MRLVHKKHNGFSVISDQLARDKRLTWKARGIFLYLWDQAENWDFYVKEVVNHAPDGKEALQNGLKELEKYGYLKRISTRSDATGKFDGMKWVLDDTPDSGQTSQETTIKADFLSDGKYSQGINDRPDNSSLSNTNNKDYQGEGISNIRNNKKSAAKAAPHIPYKEIINYLNTKTNQHLHYTTKSYQKLIKARWEDGYTLDNFKTVIDNQAYSWQGTKFWKYMRPSTLFRASKFDEYLNANNLDKHQQTQGGGYGDSSTILDNGDGPF